MNIVAIPKKELSKAYELVLQDALNQRAAISARIAVLEAEMRTVPLADWCAHILEKVGRPLFYRVVLHELAKAGVAASRESLIPELWDDARFEALGGDVWALAAWAEDIKGPHRRPDRLKVEVAKRNHVVITQGRATIADRCEAALREAGRPLSADTLPLGLSANKRSLYEMLGKDDRFRNIGGNTWALREWPQVATPPSIAGVPKLDPRLNFLDLCYSILEHAGQPLHGKAIMNTLAELGRPMPKKSINNLRQDIRKRFENLGKNTWALAEWPEEVKAPHRAD